MATVLSNPTVTVNSVALTTFCTSATLNRAFAALSDTAFGQDYESSVAGLQTNSVTLDLFMTYGASEVYATLKDLVGTKTTVTVKPTSAADSATNPGFTLTGTFLEALPHNFAMGELVQTSITFTGGAYTVDIT